MLSTTPAIIAAHTRHANCVSFTRTGRILLSGGQDGQIRLWSVPGFHAVGAIIGHRNSVNGLSFSPDEQWLATASSDGTVRVWSFPEGRPDRVLEKQIWSRFSPSGRLLATISTQGHVSLWDVASGARVMKIDPPDKRTFNVGFAPDEASLFVGGTGAIHRIAVPDGTTIATVPAHDRVVASLRVSPDGKVVATSGPPLPDDSPHSLRFWSTADLSPLGGLQLGSPGMLATAFTPDAAELAVGVEFNVITVDVAAQRMLDRRRVGVKGVYGLAWSPNGKYLANAAADGKVRVWERS